MQLHELLSVTDHEIDGWLTAKITADLGSGIEEYDYNLAPGDHVGIADHVRDAVYEWMAAGKPVFPFTVKTVEEIRAEMYPVTRRQLLRTLLEIGLKEQDIDAKLAGDPVAMIEWRYANTFTRLHPLIISVASDLNLPPEQVDSLWGFALTF